MNIAFKKLSKELNYEITDSFKNIAVNSATLEEGDIFNLSFNSDYLIPIQEMENFLDHCNKFRYKTKICFNVANPIYTKEIAFDYILFFLTHFMGQMHASNKYSLNYFFLDENELTVLLPTKSEVKAFDTYLFDLKRMLDKFGFNDLKIKTKLNENSSNILEEEKKNNDDSVARFKPTPQKSSEKPENSFKSKEVRKYSSMSITETKNTPLSFVNVSGEVFSVESFATKTGLHIITISVTDYVDALPIKVFANNESQRDQWISKCTVGNWITVFGEVKIDNYTKEHTLFSRKITVTEKEDKKTIKDEAPIKRVELSTRTVMSTMDGIASATQLFNRAKQLGHKALAIVDAESVQSFPEMQAIADKTGVKPIFGATFNIIKKDPEIVFNANEKSITDATYVVFDLETTGLSPRRDEIIEFGATKIVKGLVVDSKQFFVKATKKLKEFTINFTKITDDMLKNSKNEKEAVQDMMDYFGDSVLVAHNAKFDIGFIMEKISKYNLKPLNNVVIDTMTAARLLKPKLKSYRLEKVATKYFVNYDNTISHRADYDADVLSKIWLAMISDFTRLDVKTFNELAKQTSDNLMNNKFSNEMTILAKNQAGLKELFKLISNSHIDTFHRGPRLYQEDIKKSDNLLYGSGALKSILTEAMLNGTTKKIEETINFYDYIEVQPPSNFTHLIKRDVLSEIELKDSIKDLIVRSKKANKIVVATGDVRYLDESDKIYHRVYINSKGLGGRRHYLFKYKEINPDYPIQKFNNTQEMIQAFTFLEDINLIKEIVITNSNKIADQIDMVKVIKEKLYTPKIEKADENLKELVFKTAREKYGEALPANIEERIHIELDSIIKYGYGVIYWIAHKLVAKSIKDGYLVGSRGSVGSSLVATLSKITEVNPLPPHYICTTCKYSDFPKTSKKVGYDLEEKNCPNGHGALMTDGHTIPFETFLGFEANKVPDIDLNFSGDYQPIIHDEVKKIFGASHCFRAGTISTVAERTAFGYVKAWAEESGQILSKAFTEYLAKGVRGTKRTTGQHPGGIIVIPKEFDVEDFSPVNYPANDVSSPWKTTHFDFHAIHDNVLKLDLLGHDDPTAIRMLERLTGVKPHEIPDKDPAVISLFSSVASLGITPEDISGEQTGVMGIPEFGTKFVRNMLKVVRVKTFEDLVSVSGLSHGTDVWTNNGEVLVKDHNLELHDIISCRDDIMVDLMNEGIKPKVAFKIMEAVRKGRSLTPEQEELLKSKGVKDWYINSCKKIKYMFPKAHATAYVKMAWRIAWFKVYYPIEYYATYFTTRADFSDVDLLISTKDVIKTKLADYTSRRFIRKGEEKLSSKEQAMIPILEIAQELHARGFIIKNIDLNISKAHEWIISEDRKAIIPPFSALDGMGEAVCQSIVKAREERPFSSIKDFKDRTQVNQTSLKKINELGITKHLDATNQLSFNLF